MASRARIVLLNGVGSAGKTSIARTLQPITRAPYLHVAMDTFLEMLPEAYQDHADSFSYEAGTQDEHPAIAIHAGPTGERLMSGMRAAIAALAAEGNNLIVDDVLLAEAGSLLDYHRRLADFDLMTVAVHASLEVLEAREKARGDRLIGLARWQYQRLNAGAAHDLLVDTTRATPVECAHRIRDRFDL